MISNLDYFNQMIYEVFESSYDGIYVADAKGHAVMVNKAYTRMTGFNAQEVLFKNVKHFIKEGVITESLTLKVLEKNYPVTMVQRLNGKDLLVTGNPIYNQKGEIIYVVTNLRDITDIYRAKLEALQSKIESQQNLIKLNIASKKETNETVFHNIVAHSKEMVMAINLAQKVSKVDTSVLLLGESGVGKEVVAKLIHQSSERVNFPLVKVNCAAIPYHLLESELFGYERGAFTGADTRGKPGLFEQANGGTIFLDEVGDMPLDLQAKILRVLQEYEITRVGGTKSKKVNVRVISATNKSLEQLIDDGKFREDLYYRLNIVPIEIPPLRERKEDIAHLADFFISKTNKKYQQTKKMNPEVVCFLEMYEWPGNIREMENLIERLVVTVNHDEIQLNDLPSSMFKRKRNKQHISLRDLVDDFERKIIEDALKEHQTTRKTAKFLGISQSALVKKIQKYRIK